MKKTFKFFGIILPVALAMMFTSCSNEKSNATKLVGTWECTANEAIEPGSDWGEEESGSLKGETIVFKEDGTFKASQVKMVDYAAIVGYWSITDTSNRLYINRNNCWKIKEFSESVLKMETFFVNGATLTIDTAGANTCVGPFTREFKKQ
ncbi:MAG: hypothetical protein IK058_02220 [Bacteroidales bacterium]|nr:hypothetical protein [Bacteroidales bacterium]